MKANPDLHHRQSIRWKGYDYAQRGAYFVTLCAYRRECLFGDVVDGVARLNAWGEIVREEWLKLPRRYPIIRLDEYVVMPNHFHGIIRIDTVGAGLAPPSDESPGTGGGASPAPTGASGGEDALGGKRVSLGDVVGAFKSLSTLAVNKHRNAPGNPVWQRNYHDRVIRDGTELRRIRRYIIENPLHWDTDTENPSVVAA